MVADADAVVESIRGALEAELPQEAIWLQMSTIGEQGTERCVALAREHSVSFTDAPVLVTKEPAQKGELLIMEGAAETLALADVLGLDASWCSRRSAAGHSTFPTGR